MNIENLRIIASTVVQLGQLVVAIYAITSLKALVIHWLDSRLEPLPPFYPRLTAEERQIDAARTAGTEAPTDTVLGL